MVGYGAYSGYGGIWWYMAYGGVLRLGKFSITNLVDLVVLWFYISLGGIDKTLS